MENPILKNMPLLCLCIIVEADGNKIYECIHKIKINSDIFGFNTVKLLQRVTITN